MEDREEEEGKDLVMGFCVGQVCPSSCRRVCWGGVFWAFEDNDGDSDRRFKVGSAGIMPTGWQDDEPAAVRTAVLALWHADSALGWTTVLACWCDDELAAGQTTMLTRWRDDELAAGRKARGTPPACNH